MALTFKLYIQRYRLSLLFFALGCLFNVHRLYAQDIGNIASANPFEIHGNTSLSAGYYNTNSFKSSRRPFAYSMLMSPVVSVYGVQIPLNFTFTEGSKNVKNPFAQFGLNPYYKWVKGYLGWSNMTWSPGTLNGKTFLGIGVDINPSVFRFGAFYGRLNRPLRENLLGDNVQQPQYKRKGWGLKLGIGKENNFVDFIWLHGKDDPNSIPLPADTLNKIDYTPAENAVIGIKSHQAFSKKKNFIWDIDGSVSAWTRDINSQLLDIGTGFGSGFIKVAIPPRLSTSYAWTAHTSMLYKADNFSLGFDYNRVQPEYRSMGLDYLLNDQQKITLLQTASVSNKKVNLSFNEYYQHDNLNNRKAVRTNRAGINATVNYNANEHFGMVISYNNFNMFQSRGLKEVNDSTKIFQLQNTIVFVPRYTIIGKNSVQNIYTSVSYSRLDDLNKISAQYSKNQTINTNIGYSITLTKLLFTFSPSFNILNTKTPVLGLFNIGPAFAFGKGFVNGKYNVSTSLGFINSRLNGVWSNKTITNTIGFNWKISKTHALAFSNSIMNNRFSGASRHEYKGSITYTYTFNYVVKNNTCK
jgi:hypothetical protein